MLKKSLKNKKEIFKMHCKQQLACSAFFLKSHKFKQLMFPYLHEQKEKARKLLQTKKRTNWFKAFNWSLLKIDPIYIIARSYYWLTSVLLFIVSILIIATLDFQNVFSSVFQIILLVINAYILVNSAIVILKNSYYSLKFKLYKLLIDKMPRVNFLSGGPGCGKTSLSIVIVVLRAKYMWNKLKLKAFFARSKNPSKLSATKLEKYNEVMCSYNFYLAHPDRIPCLWSNIPLKDFRGRKAFKLKKAHLFQKKKLPLYSVMFSDEIGNQFAARKGNNDNLQPLSRLARFIRHFFDGAWHVTEQEVSKAFVDIRRVSGSNKWLYQQCWKMKPTRLIRLFDFLKAFASYNSTMMTIYKQNTSQYNYHLKKSQQQSKHWTPLLQFLTKLIACIGWRQYEYQELGNSESNTGAESKHGFIVVPACLTAKYDDRAYRRMYEAYDLPIEDSAYTELTLTNEDLAEIFPKDEEDKNKKKEK